MEASRVGSSWLRRKRSGQKNQPLLYTSAWFMQRGPQIFTVHLLRAARDWEDSYLVGQGKGLWHMGNPDNCLERHFLERKNSSCPLLHDNLSWTQRLKVTDSFIYIRFCHMGGAQWGRLYSGWPMLCFLRQLHSSGSSTGDLPMRESLVVGQFMPLSAGAPQVSLHIFSFSNHLQLTPEKGPKRTNAIVQVFVPSIIFIKSL